MNGLIDEVRVYDFAFADADVAAVYGGGAGDFGLTVAATTPGYDLEFYADKDTDGDDAGKTRWAHTIMSCCWTTALLFHAWPCLVV